MGACSMCMGTDCAGDCARGNCYWEYQQEMQAQWEAEQEAEYQQHLEDAQQASGAIAAFAQALYQE